MQHVDELQASLQAKDSEIAMLQDKCASHQAAPSNPAAAAAPDTHRLELEVQKHKQNVKKVQDQLTAALERERVLQQHVAQLQREFPRAFLNA